jgi:hypothetical protein
MSLEPLKQDPPVDSCKFECHPLDLVCAAANACKYQRKYKRHRCRSQLVIGRNILD